MGTPAGEATAMFIFVSLLFEVSLLKEKICSYRNKFFSLRVHTILEGLRQCGEQIGSDASYFPS